jgi:hypothetical protein
MTSLLTGSHSVLQGHDIAGTGAEKEEETLWFTWLDPCWVNAILCPCYTERWRFGIAGMGALVLLGWTRAG